MNRTLLILVLFAASLAAATCLSGCQSSAAAAAEKTQAWDGAGYQTEQAVPRHSGLSTTAPPHPQAVDPRTTWPSGSLPSPDEEVWVIVRDRPGYPAAGAAAEDLPGSGAIICLPPSGGEHVPVPLQHTDVSASIDGYIATVDVRQRFHNPYQSKIEAVYLFPLPENAAVNDFVMQVGDRRIRGIIRERQEAEVIYQQAKSQGYTASLLTQERPNIFTQKIANIEPGRAIDVTIRYFHTLRYEDGWYAWTLPMTIGPRFNPPQVRDSLSGPVRLAAVLQLPSPPQVRDPLSGPVHVPYLKPGQRAGGEVAVSLDIDAGVHIEQIACDSHRVKIDHHGAHARLTLSGEAAIANRDMVVRYRVAGEQLKASLLTQQPAGDEGYFSLMVYPPASLERLRRQPLELIFVLDTSGSMRGKPLEQAKEAVDQALRNLDERDTFQVIRFSDQASQFGERPVAATSPNVRAARQYLRSLQAGGGTMMLNGLRQALGFAHDPMRLRYVVFLTDGYIGNEAEVLGELQQRLGASRIFSFGIGEAPNRYLMQRMAKLGRGAVAFLPLEADADGVMDLFIERISHPAMTDIRIDWGGLEVYDLHPAVPQDLFIGRPLVITGRYRGHSNRRPTIRLTGVAADQQITLGIRGDLDRADGHHAALPAVWARQQIADLMDQATFNPQHDGRRRIRDLALSYNLLSAYTAFVGVDASQPTAGRFGTTVDVPLPTPPGVPYETTVGR